MPLLETPPGIVTQIDGREYVYFAGTGYLGLQGHPEVIRAACRRRRTIRHRQRELAHRLRRHAARAGGRTPRRRPVRPRRRVLLSLPAGWATTSWRSSPAAGPVTNAYRRVLPLQRCSRPHSSNGWPHATFRHRDPGRSSIQTESTRQARRASLVLRRRGFCRDRADSPVAGSATFYTITQGRASCSTTPTDWACSGKTAAARSNTRAFGVWREHVGGPDRRLPLALFRNAEQGRWQVAGVLPGCGTDPPHQDAVPLFWAGSQPAAHTDCRRHRQRRSN